MIAIVDYGMGNLASVRSACAAVGLTATITSSPEQVAAADGVVLPGVGAFGDAIATLERTGLAEAIRLVAESGRPLLGVCLGMQLLLSQSVEFGSHRGLGLVEGEVLPLPRRDADGRRLKVPRVGWEPIEPAEGADWTTSPLADLRPGSYMYFVHSFYPEPSDPGVVVATALHGPLRYCAALRSGNIFACQFHPERSGVEGLTVYRRIFAASCDPEEGIP
jgi:glutamine amidotransferase